MKHVTVDAALQKQFDEGLQPLEVRDASGKLLGYFVKKDHFYSLIEPPMSDEEWERRLQSGGGRTWAEIRADFEQKYGAAGA